LLLQRFFILVIQAIFDDDNIVAFTDFAVLLRFGFSPSLRLSLKSRRGG
jgi:hypothetical protein